MMIGTVRVDGGGGGKAVAMPAIEARMPRTKPRLIRNCLTFDMLGYPDLA